MKSYRLTTLTMKPEFVFVMVQSKKQSRSADVSATKIIIPISKAIRDTLGFLAVVASLVFVGLEIQQNNTLARGQARQALAELNQQWLVLLSQDAEFNRIHNKVWRSEAELTPQEWDRGKWMMTLHLRRMENVFFQRSEGLVDKSALHSYGLQTAARDFGTLRFNQYWIEDNWRSGFDPAFVKFLEDQFDY